MKGSQPRSDKGRTPLEPTITHGTDNHLRNRPSPMEPTITYETYRKAPDSTTASHGDRDPQGRDQRISEDGESPHGSYKTPPRERRALGKGDRPRDPERESSPRSMTPSPRRTGFRLRKSPASTLHPPPITPTQGSRESDRRREDIYEAWASDYDQDQPIRLPKNDRGVPERSRVDQMPEREPEKDGVDPAGGKTTVNMISTQRRRPKVKPPKAFTGGVNYSGNLRRTTGGT